MALRFAAGWAEMSRRYVAPAAGAATTGGPTTDEEAAPADLWRALDEGRDPR